MALMDDLRTKLTAIGNAIRSKTGGSDPLTLDGMVDAINGISTGGGGGGGGTAGPTIDDGFIVNFYNHDKELIEVHGAKCGMFIDKPLSYTSESWQNADGYVNTFPLTVNSAGAVVDLYAGGACTCEYMLYSHFGIDKRKYPAVIVSICNHTNYGGDTKVIFGTSTSVYTDNSYDYNYLGTWGDKMVTNKNLTLSFGTDISHDVLGIITNLSKSDLGSPGYAMDGYARTQPKGVYRTYANFHHEWIDGRLDTEFYVIE